MRMQASLLASAALTAEVDTLKQNLERSEQELGRAKKQLEEKEGKKYLVEYVYKKGAIAKNDRIDMAIAGATSEVATLKQALLEAEKKATTERTEREKYEAQVGKVRQELQVLMKKHESLELDSKTRASELAVAIENAKSAMAESQKALQELDEVKR